MGDEQSQEQPCSVKPQSSPVGGCHINDSVNSINIKEKCQQEKKSLLLVAHIFEGMAETAKAFAKSRARVRYIMELLVIA